jgi:hypothetical protein
VAIYEYNCDCDVTVEILIRGDQDPDAVECEVCKQTMCRKTVYLQKTRFTLYGGTAAAEDGVYESGLARFSGDPRARVQTKAQRTELLDSMKRKADEDGVPWRVTRATDIKVGEGATKNETNTQAVADAFKAAKYSGENL